MPVVGVKQLLVTLLLLFSSLVTATPVAQKDVYKPNTYEINPPTTDLVWFVIEYYDEESKSYHQLDISIELFGSIAPKTVHNFHQLANGVKALLPNFKSEEEAVTLSYKDTKINIFEKDQYVQLGDIIPEIAPFSIYGLKFDDESFQVTFDRPGRVAMANSGPDTNACQFFITTDALPSLDNNYVAFGQVVDGLDTIIEKLQYLKDVTLPEGAMYKARVQYCSATGLHHDNIEGAKEVYLKEVAQYRSGVITEENSMVFDPMARSKAYEASMDLIFDKSGKKIENSSPKHVFSSQSSKVPGVKTRSSPVELLAVLFCKLILILSVGFGAHYGYSKYKFKILSKFGSGASTNNDNNVVGLRHE